MNKTERRVKLICNNNRHNGYGYKTTDPEYRFVTDFKIFKDIERHRRHTIHYINVMFINNNNGSMRVYFSDKKERMTFARYWFYYGFGPGFRRKMLSPASDWEKIENECNKKKS